MHSGLHCHLSVLTIPAARAAAAAAAAGAVDDLLLHLAGGQTLGVL